MRLARERVKNARSDASYEIERTKLKISTTGGGVRVNECNGDYY